MLRLDAVRKDDKVSPERKDALLQGHLRLESNHMFRVLTPEQRADVGKRMLAQRKAEAQKRPQQQQVTPQVTPASLALLDSRSGRPCLGPPLPAKGAEVFYQVSS